MYIKPKTLMWGQSTDPYQMIEDLVGLFYKIINPFGGAGGEKSKGKVPSAGSLSLPTSSTATMPMVSSPSMLGIPASGSWTWLTLPTLSPGLLEGL